jgi:hypothetical protein
MFILSDEMAGWKGRGGKLESKRRLPALGKRQSIIRIILNIDRV